MGIVMGYWDCGYCGTKAIGGDTKVCPNCGMTRNEGTRFYMDKNMKVKRLSDEEARAVEEKGADWICSYCDGLNPASANICETCGAPRDNASADYFENKRRSDEEAIGTIRAPTYEETEGDAGTKAMPRKTTTRRGKRAIFAAVAIAIVTALVFLGAKIFAPREATMLVTGTEWQYEVEIEAYKTVRESGWSIPPGGRLSYTSQEIHHYDKVFDHYETKYRQVPDGYEEYVAGYEDMGNGYMREIIRQRPKYKSEAYQDPVYRQEPAYATKYYYDIERWKYDRTETSRGSDKLCRWPELRLDGDERTGSRREIYRATGLIDGKSVAHEISKADFDKIEEGMELKVVLRIGRKMEILWDDSEKTY